MPPRSWVLGLDSRAESDAWFAKLLEHRASEMAPPELPTGEESQAEHADFADVLLAQGYIEVQGWEGELAASASEESADELASIRAVIASALAWTQGPRMSIGSDAGRSGRRPALEPDGPNRKPR